jgi:hypothetical protein
VDTELELSLARRLPNTDLLVGVGQTSDEVRIVYKITAQPRPFSTPLNPQTVLSAPEQGLMFFFNRDNDRLVTIRVEKPFNGRVLGVSVGDTIAKVKAALGEPTNQFQSGLETAHFYARPDTSVRFDSGQDGKVVTILVVITR